MLERALHCGDGSGGDADVADRRGEVTVAKQGLDNADINPLLDEMRCKGIKGMAQAVEGCMLADACCRNRRCARRVENGRIEWLVASTPGKQPITGT